MLLIDLLFWDNFLSFMFNVAALPGALWQDIYSMHHF